MFLNRCRFYFFSIPNNNDTSLKVPAVHVYNCQPWQIIYCNECRLSLSTAIHKSVQQGISLHHQSLQHFIRCYAMNIQLSYKKVDYMTKWSIVIKNFRNFAKFLAF